MIYQNFQDLKLSALGLGCMRLPTVDGQDHVIDMERTAEMVKIAFENGINYVDTAWFYHGGNSEIAMGTILKNYPRESFYLATKFPGLDAEHGYDTVQKVFERQLEKCQVDFFDFYLFHNVSDGRLSMMMDPEIGVYDYLVEQKRQGRIRHLGFSTHGSLECMRKFLDAYGDELEFCQIQLNWLDWKLQDAKAKVELLNSRNIPVWVMEPVRGGRLVNLPQEDVDQLTALRPGVTTPEWAFRFLQSIPGVTMILSGMSSMEQLRANLHTFEVDKPLTDEESAALSQIVEKMMARKSIPCTACHYCVSHCPQGLDIPRLIALYHEHLLTVEDGGMAFIAPMALMAIPKEKRPASCLHCQSCEQVCPQQIHISDFMTDFVEKIG
jgi:predicted aldo/keto reductase-like oxidoreductase